MRVAPVVRDLGRRDTEHASAGIGASPGAVDEGGGTVQWLRWIPRADTLASEEWTRRHLTVTGVALVAAVVVVVADALLGSGRAAVLALACAAVALAARARRPSPRVRSVAAAGALAALAAVVVESTGTAEAHFLFFIVVPLVAFYEDWLPFAVSLLLVFAHHAVVGTFAPERVFDHAGGHASPVGWAAIHVGALALMVGATLMHWWLHDRGRRERDALLAALRREARTDPLTGIANRTALLERLDAELARTARHGRPLTVAALDLDGFKAVNDRHGHAAGDRVLQQVATQLLATCRASDLLARTGGDEFVLVLPEVDLADAREVAERLVAAGAVTGPDAPTAAVSASVGVTFAEPGRSVDAVLAAADAAMYAAKARGRGAVVLAGDPPGGPDAARPQFAP